MIQRKVQTSLGDLSEGDVNTSNLRTEWTAREISSESKAWLARDSEM